MHKDYFPICPVDGPIEPPVPYGHLYSRGVVPNKCASCKYIFEGECLRASAQVGRFMHLDFGPCGIPGPTDPVTYEDRFITSKVEVPRKCAKCCFLAYDSIRGFDCTKEAATWGDIRRGLDWGSWSPETIYLELPLPKITTKKLSEFAHQNDLVSFIKEYRRINPGLSITEARADFESFRSILEPGLDRAPKPGE